MAVLYAMVLCAAMSRAQMRAADRDYLRSLARDTWACISQMADEKTGHFGSHQVRGYPETGDLHFGEFRHTLKYAAS